MSDRDLQDCIDEAKESLKEAREDWGEEAIASGDVYDVIHEVADGAVPVYNADLIDVFRSDSSLWCETPDAPGASIISSISWVVYDAIYNALCEYLRELEEEGEP